MTTIRERIKELLNDYEYDAFETGDAEKVKNKYTDLILSEIKKEVVKKMPKENFVTEQMSAEARLIYGERNRMLSECRKVIDEL